MQNLKLISPTIDLEREHAEMLREWMQTGERMVPVTLQYDSGDFKKYIAKLEDCAKGIGLPDGYVPNSTFWLIDEANRILGTIDIRHRLTDFLMVGGGHIGYGVRPSERNKGYATKMLELSLAEAKKLKIEKALITCDADNLASKNVILKNGGVLYKENILDGAVKLSFWIAP
ncbi:MAG: GNAT family N-acetyltransferase [Bacteroidia bacterium]